MKYLQGKFKPKNPDKYLGDSTNIIFRSSWELTVFRWLDNQSNVINWASESVIVPYHDPVSNRQRRYFPDLYVKFRHKDGSIKDQLWEIKPEKQTREPEVRKKITKGYIAEIATYGTNQAKWEAATKFCENLGWDFMMITEKDLGLKK
jgi:hypothetical protein